MATLLLHTGSSSSPSSAFVTGLQGLADASEHPPFGVGLLGRNGRLYSFAMRKPSFTAWLGPLRHAPALPWEVSERRPQWVSVMVAPAGSDRGSLGWYRV